MSSTSLPAAVLLTLNLSVTTSAVLFFLGYPLALWLTSRPSPLKTIIRAAINLPLVLPPTVLGYYLLVALGRDGIITQLVGIQLAFSYPGLLIGSILYSLPFAVNPYLSALEGLDSKYAQGARALGLSHLQTIIYIVIPLTRHGILNGTAMSFAHTIGEFGVVLLIGGNINGQTQTASIYLFDLVQALEFEQANQLALMLLVTSVLLLVLIQIANTKLVYKT
ncbi:MAG: molybdate ABC transporter permease subunit [Deinococcales bacterium]